MKRVLFVLFFLVAISFHSQKQMTSNIVAQELKNAVLAGGKLMRIAAFPSQYLVPRPVDVWLPENYSSDKKYAVLYMHDGQNLFDETTTWNKQEWKIDEVATRLMKEGATKDFIVVGVHNIPSIRWQDLFPEKAMNFVPKEQKEALYAEAKKNNFSVNLNGDNYLKFIVEELKTYIDNNYSVLKDKQNTFIMGSSMGGLMSMYAVAEYPEVFQAGACLSTHWVGATPSKTNPLPAAIFAYLQENVPNSDNHRMYFDYGNKTLDQFYPQYAPKVDAIFTAVGYTEENFKNLFFKDTDHSENSWQKRVDVPLTFLLEK